MNFTPEQQDRFVDHLMNCHSWYKHLPLMEGNEFYIVVDENAGRSYPTQHPRLPFGNDQRNYVEAFGYLDFYWDHQDDLFLSDSHTDLYSSAEIKQKFKKHIAICLFPYMSPEFSEESISKHEEDFIRITKGAPHEEAERLKAYYKIGLEMNEMWYGGLTGVQRKSICEGPRELEWEQSRSEELKKNSYPEEFQDHLDHISIIKHNIANADPTVKRYWTLESELKILTFELNSVEKSKIIKAVFGLK